MLAGLPSISCDVALNEVTSGERPDLASPAAFGTLGQMPRVLIIVGALLVAAGLLWPLIAKLGLGRLPGDIVIERENFRLYVPITSAILVSVVLSLVFWLLRRF